MQQIVVGEVLYFQCPYCGYKYRPRRRYAPGTVIHTQCNNPTCRRRFDVRIPELTPEVIEVKQEIPKVEIKPLTMVDIVYMPDAPEYWRYCSESGEEVSVEGYLKWHEQNQ